MLDPKKGNQRNWHPVIAVFYYIALCLIYTIEISTFWEYMGFQMQFSTEKFVLLTIFIATIGLTIPTTPSTRSLFLTLLFYAGLIPYCVLLAFLNHHPDALFGGPIAYACVALASKIRLPAKHAAAFSSKQFVWFSLAFGCFTILLYVRATGLSGFETDLYDVYELRRETAEATGETAGKLASIASKVFLPMALILAFQFSRTNRIVYASLTISVAFLLFGFWHHKSAFFGPVLALGLFIATRNSKTTVKLATAMIGLIAISVLEILARTMVNAEGPSPLTSLIIRRLLLIPALADFYHIEFFSVYPKFYWTALSQHITGTGSGYETGAAQVIGNAYFNREQMSFNTGMVGSGYAQFGFLGIIVYSTIIGGIIAFLNSLGKVVGHSAIFAISAFAVHTALISSDLITTLISHGLLVLLLALIFFPRNSKSMRATATDMLPSR